MSTLQNAVSIIRVDRTQLEYSLYPRDRPDNVRIVIRECRLGIGVFASRDMRPGEFVAGFYGEIYVAKRASLLPASVRNHAIQFSTNQWRDSVGVARYLNHSCEPNCCVNGEFDVTTLRTIKAGEELLWDYSTTENSDWVVPGRICLCGSSNCRGTIPPYRELSITERMSVSHRIANWIRFTGPYTPTNCGRTNRDSLVPARQP